MGSSGGGGTSTTGAEHSPEMRALQQAALPEIRAMLQTNPLSTYAAWSPRQIAGSNPAYDMLFNQVPQMQSALGGLNLVFGGPQAFPPHTMRRSTCHETSRLARLTTELATQFLELRLEQQPPELLSGHSAIPLPQPPAVLSPASAHRSLRRVSQPDHQTRARYASSRCTTRGRLLSRP